MGVNEGKKGFKWMWGVLFSRGCEVSFMRIEDVGNYFNLVLI